MFGLKLPALAAAGAVTVLAVGGMSALPRQAVADDGGTGASSTATTDPGLAAGATTPPGPGADTAVNPDAAADPGTDTGTGTDAGTGAGTDALTGTSAGAADGGSYGETMNVSPQTVAPGGVVTIRLQTACSSGHKAKASAEVFVNAVTLAPAGDGNGLEGNAFIKSDAIAGSYAVSVDCDGVTSTAQASITVVSTSQPVTPTAPVTPVTPTYNPVKPVKPVPAGGGGSAQLAAGPAEAGNSTGALLATGAFAAVGLTGLVLHRRRGDQRG